MQKYLGNEDISTNTMRFEIETSNVPFIQRAFQFSYKNIAFFFENHIFENSATGYVTKKEAQISPLLSPSSPSTICLHHLPPSILEQNLGNQPP